MEASVAAACLAQGGVEAQVVSRTIQRASEPLKTGSTSSVISAWQSGLRICVRSGSSAGNGGDAAFVPAPVSPPMIVQGGRGCMAAACFGNGVVVRIS